MLVDDQNDFRQHPLEMRPIDFSESRGALTDCFIDSLQEMHPKKTSADDSLQIASDAITELNAGHLGLASQKYLKTILYAQSQLPGANRESVEETLQSTVDMLNESFKDMQSKNSLRLVVQSAAPMVAKTGDKPDLKQCVTYSLELKSPLSKSTTSGEAEFKTINMKIDTVRWHMPVNKPVARRVPQA